MTHTSTLKTHFHIRNAFLVLGAVLILAGSGQGIHAQVSGQGSTVMEEAPYTEHILVQGFALHASPGDEGSAGGLIALGALFLFIGLGFHALIRLPNERKVKVRPAPQYKKKLFGKGRKSRLREVIWVEKVIRF